MIDMGILRAGAKGRGEGHFQTPFRAGRATGIMAPDSSWGTFDDEALPCGSARGFDAKRRGLGDRADPAKRRHPRGASGPAEPAGLPRGGAAALGARDARFALS